MSFLTGRISCIRLNVEGQRPRLFDAEFIERLEEFQSGRQKIASSDGVETGWAAGNHMLDTDFQPAKNIYGDWLCFDLCITTDKLPSDRFRAYYEVELAALAKGNPSGLPSSRQKKEAKEIARERLEQEAKDGRYRKNKLIPVAWHAVTNRVYFGATSLTHLDRLISLFQQTFRCGLNPMAAGEIAHSIGTGRLTQVDDISPSAFVPNNGDDIAWIADETSRDFLGNEFLLWLWYTGEAVSDTLKLSDNSEATFMLTNKVKLECPRGQTGKDAITHEGPTRLPEAKRAIRAGKLPRSVGMTVIRQSEQFEFVVAAETLALSGMKVPNPDENTTEPHARCMERLDKFAFGIETLEMMYEYFLTVRLSRQWADVLKSMQTWLAKNG